VHREKSQLKIGRVKWDFETVTASDYTVHIEFSDEKQLSMWRALAATELAMSKGMALKTHLINEVQKHGRDMGSDVELVVADAVLVF